MKALVTGSAGFVGKNIFKHLVRNNYDVSGISRRDSETTTHQFDLSHPASYHTLNQIKPELIIHSAGLTHVDYCEENREEAWRHNVGTTKTLVDWASKNGGKFVYISSDYVYSGETNGYDESSETRPINYYGESKLEAEGLVSTLEKHTILRPTVIFGEDPNGMNFLMQILGTKDKRKIPYDQISNPTSMSVLLKYVEGALEEDLEGTFVATGPESMGRMEFLYAIADVFGIDKILFEPVKTSQLNQVARRPLNNGTDSSKIGDVLNYKRPSVLESLQEIKNERQN